MRERGCLGFRGCVSGVCLVFFFLCVCVCVGERERIRDEQRMTREGDRTGRYS